MKKKNSRFRLQKSFIYTKVAEKQHKIRILMIKLEIKNTCSIQELNQKHYKK